MIENASGLILRTRPLTETSLIVHWLTPDLGRIATVAKGARRPKSPFAGKLDLFHSADFSFTRSRRSELHTLREASLRDMRPTLRTDLSRLQFAAYASACVELTTETETPIPEIFSLVRDFLDHLGQAQTLPPLIFAFELKLLALLGLDPDWEELRLAAPTRELAEALQLHDWPQIEALAVSERQVRELRDWLHGFLIFHLGRLPRGRADVTLSQLA
jgi:DNA repair protein RecO (recombination protein O)